MLAMLLLVGYVASTRYYRREKDVTTFMATIRPIATVQAVRPNVEREQGRTLAAIRERLDSESFEAAWAHGRGLPVDQAVAYAVAEPAQREL